MEKLLEMLKLEYGIHSAILYGSRTTEVFFPDSDFDILSIRKTGERVRKVFSFDNMMIDLIVDIEELIHQPENYTYLWSHRVLLDEKGFSSKLIEAHRKYLSQPAPKLPDNRIVQRKIQLRDELKYIKQGGELGHYRYHDLLSKILPLYFGLIGEWYLGDKHALKWLELNKLEFFKAFSKAIDPQATYKEIETLVALVCD